MKVFSVIITCLTAQCPWPEKYRITTMSAENADICVLAIARIIYFDGYDPSTFSVVCEDRRS